MAAVGFTPISLYHSTTASAVPTSGNLVAGELALNTLDEKLYFKNSAGTVKLLASNAASTGTVSSVAATVPAFLSIAGSPITTSGTLAITLSGTALPIANGGTGQTTANAAFNALVPSQTGQSGKYLTTDGTNTSWGTNPLGTVTSVGQSFTGGLISVAGSPVTTSGTLALTVAGTSGGIPYFSSASTWATSAALASNALVVGGGAGLAPATVTTGTGVVTALGVAVGTAGSFVVNGGVLGTPSSGTLTNCTFPTLNQNTTGNAATATILQTARTINGVSFNGSANITVAATTTNTLTLGTYLTGTSFNGSAAVTAAVDATSANTASKVVARDASGNFSAGTITATLSGNASTATSATSATTATNATNVAVTVSSTASAFKIPFANTTVSTTGNYGLLQDDTATFTYNPSTNTITAGTFSGALSGNATTATSATSATTATTATNLAGGSAGTVPYQSAAGTTVQLAAGTSGFYLKSNGAAAPSWAAVAGGSQAFVAFGTSGGY